jgi:CHASE2 domain-containing sensor protein
MIRLAPLAAWRDPLRRHDFEQLAGPGGGIKPGQLDGKIVLVGDARPGEDEFRVLQGLRPELRHGVELHADVVNNLLQGVHVRRLGATPQFLLMLVLAAAGGWLRVFRPATSVLARRLLVFAVVLAYLALTIVIYTSSGVLLNTAYHIGAFLLSYWLLGRLTLHWRQVTRDPRP